MLQRRAFDNESKGFAASAGCGVQCCGDSECNVFAASAAAEPAAPAATATLHVRPNKISCALTKYESFGIDQNSWYYGVRGAHARV